MLEETESTLRRCCTEEPVEKGKLIGESELSGRVRKGAAVGESDGVCSSEGRVDKAMVCGGPSWELSFS